jgi:DNA-binding response OmpR family regulator
MAESDLDARGIVVVDDAPANLILLANILEEAGYEVRVANSALRALTLIFRQPPDLVILDVNLPDKSGYEVCAELKAKPELKNIPVLFLSADDSPAAEARALEAGGAQYLLKPFEAKDVLKAIALELRLSRALRDKEASDQERNRWRRQAETTFEALCAALPGTVLSGGYRVRERIETEPSASRFRGARIDTGDSVVIEIFRPGPDANKEFESGRAEASVIGSGVSEWGVPYLVRPADPA